MLITAFRLLWPKVHRELCHKGRSLTLAKNLLGFEPGTFQFWSQHIDPLDHSLPIAVKYQSVVSQVLNLPVKRDIQLFWSKHFTANSYLTATHTSWHVCKLINILDHLAFWVNHLACFEYFISIISLWKELIYHPGESFIVFINTRFQKWIGFLLILFQTSYIDAFKKMV